MDKMTAFKEKNNPMISPAKWRRSGTDRRQQADQDTDYIDKRESKNRRTAWLDVASKIIYPEN